MKVLTLFIIGFFVSSLPSIAHGQKVNIHEGVEIGHIKQWIGAVGNDETKPLLLFLHGGPGFSSRAYSKKFIKYLKNDFIVVQWDQRNTGFTKAWSGITDSISLELMYRDTEEVVQYLLTKFNRKKLFLVGFSWGGFLGMRFASEHPQLLFAYISVSSMIHGDASEKMTLSVIRERANQANKLDAIQQLSNIKIPFQSWEDLYIQRKWTAHYSNGKSSKKKYPKSLFEEWSLHWMPLFLEASKTNFTEEIQELACPIFFFISHRDLVSNYQIAESYYETIRAPHKELIWFEKSTHEIPSEEPEKFSRALIESAKKLSTH